MPIAENDIKRISRPALNAMENAYVPSIVKGFGTTVRHFFTSFE